MEIVISMIAFFALVASWFVLPASPPVTATAATSEGLAQAA
jgi:hypothetical protein